MTFQSSDRDEQSQTHLWTHEFFRSLRRVYTTKGQCTFNPPSPRILTSLRNDLGVEDYLDSDGGSRQEISVYAIFSGFADVRYCSIRVSPVMI
jgi:hypothetical protein